MNVLAEWTERLGTHTASAWITCHGHRKPVHPMHRFLWSTFLIQRWFSNEISLDFCKHKSNPRGRRSGNSILGNAVWGKMNPEAVLFPETRSCFLVSFRHIDTQWEICFLNSVYWDVTKGFNYLHIHENNMRWKEVWFVLLLHSYCLKPCGLKTGSLKERAGATGQCGHWPKASSCCDGEVWGEEEPEIRSFSDSPALRKRASVHVSASAAVCPILLVSEHQDGLSKK